MPVYRVTYASGGEGRVVEAADLPAAVKLAGSLGGADRLLGLGRMVGVTEISVDPVVRESAAPSKKS